MKNSKQTTNPWEMMYEPFKGIYTKDEIDEMSFAEIGELMDQLMKKKITNLILNNYGIYKPQRLPQL